MAGSSADSWFENLFGFRERTGQKGYGETQGNFRLQFLDGHLTSTVSGKRYAAGRFATPALRELREEGMRVLRGRFAWEEDAAVAGDGITSSEGGGGAGSSAAAGAGGASPQPGVLLDHIAVVDILPLHAQHPGAVFQAASQFNCLEFPSPRTEPEDGVAGYVYDNTQGPACSMACAAGTVVRNYLIDVADHAAPGTVRGPAVLGQRANRQVNNLDLLEQAVAKAAAAAAARSAGAEAGAAGAGAGAGSATPSSPSPFFWTVHNGYTKSSDERLAGLGGILDHSAWRESMLGLVKIGVHWDVGVTFSRRYVPIPPEEAPTVTQAFCSAVSVAYASGTSPASWAPLARLVLDACYEATLWAGVINAAKTGKKDVFLTFVGGGVFGNANEWIDAAIARAVRVVGAAGADLRVHLCHFRRVDKGRVEDITRRMEKGEV